MREEILIHLGKKWRSELMYRLKSLITRLCSRVNGVVNNYELAKSMSPGHQGKRRWREKKERKEKNGRGERERRKENLKWDFQTKATVWVVAHGIVALYPPRSIDETEGVASPSLQMPRKHFSTRTGSTVVSRFPDIRSLLFFLFKLLILTYRMEIGFFLYRYIFLHFPHSIIYKPFDWNPLIPPVIPSLKHVYFPWWNITEFVPFILSSNPCFSNMFQPRIEIIEIIPSSTTSSLSSSISPW